MRYLPFWLWVWKNTILSQTKSDCLSHGWISILWYFLLIRYKRPSVWPSERLAKLDFIHSALLNLLSYIWYVIQYTHIIMFVVLTKTFYSKLPLLIVTQGYETLCIHRRTHHVCVSQSNSCMRICLHLFLYYLCICNKLTYCATQLVKYFHI